MSVYVFALLIGVIAGLRTMSAPAAVSWAAYLGLLNLHDTPLAFLGYAWTPYVLTLLAIAELVTDQLPATPRRTAPAQFGARLVSGAFCGAAIGLASEAVGGGLAAGVIGAALGTLGGARARAMLARALGEDHYAAVIEDVVAVCGAMLIAVAAA